MFGSISQWWRRLTTRRLQHVDDNIWISDSWNVDWVRGSVSLANSRRLTVGRGCERTAEGIRVRVRRAIERFRAATKLPFLEFFDRPTLPCKYFDRRGQIFRLETFDGFAPEEWIRQLLYAGDYDLSLFGSHFSRVSSFISIWRGLKTKRYWQGLYFRFYQFLSSICIY